MKVLWLSSTAAGADKLMKSADAGRGWIASLEEGIKRVPGITLAVGFFHETAAPAFENAGVWYYPIEKKNTGFAGKLKRRLFNDLYDVNPAGIKTVIDTFAPDVIHIFGSESGMVDALAVTNIPVIIHIQGLVRPYYAAWFPKGMSQFSIFSNSSLRALLFRRGYYFEYRPFGKRALKEDKALAAAQYFFGRTAWDKNYLELVKDDFTYYHCEEVLRPFFYQHEWQQPAAPGLQMVTVINAQLYKGLEMILETAHILTKFTKLQFKWHIVGMAGSSEIVPIIEKGMKKKFSENNVSFRGAQVNDALIRELKQANLFIHPSHIDNSPNSVCEAMLLGMPVLAGNAGGLSSIVQHGTDGMLYNSYDAYELAGLIKKAVQQPEYMVGLGVNARKRAMVRHNIDTITNTVISAYQELINKKKTNGKVVSLKEWPV